MRARCSICGRVEESEEPGTCRRCGSWGILEIDASGDLPAEGGGIERFLPMLPAPPRVHPAASRLRVGDTPLVEAPMLAAALGLSRLRLKDEGRNPSGSIQDRASWLAALHAGRRTVALSSTRAAALSSALMCAALGSLAVVFVSQDHSTAEIGRLQSCGARVFRVQGDGHATRRLCNEAIQKLNWYVRNPGINPILVEGKKTCGLELGEAEPADWVAVPVSDGCVVAAVWKGLKEMHAVGRLARLPRILAVQATGAPTIFEEWRRSGDEGPARPPRPAPNSTRIRQLRSNRPRNWRRAVRAVNESNGRMVSVSDDDISTAMALTSRLSGVFPGLPAAAAIAGLAQLRPGGSAIAVLTGAGLGSPDREFRNLAYPMDVPVDVRAVQDAMEMSNWGIH